MIKKKTLSLNSSSPSYPQEDFIHVPIINSKNKEVILLYIPEEEIENFNSVVNPNNIPEILEDKDIIQNLIQYFKNHIKRNFLYGIEKRLEYAYKNMVRQIFYSQLISIYFDLNRKKSNQPYQL